jgi:hypothetical protein
VHTRPSQPPANALPRWLTLLIIQLTGIAMVVVGFHPLIYGDVFLAKPFGLVLVLTGVDLLLRPGARRKVPRLDKLLLKLVDHWRAPPVP